MKKGIAENGLNCWVRVINMTLAGNAEPANVESKDREGAMLRELVYQQ